MMSHRSWPERLFFCCTLLVFVACARPAPPGVPPVTTPIALNSAIEGALTEGMARLADGSVFRLYSFYGTAGETVQIELTSRDFDAYLIVWNDQGQDVTRDDDSGGGTDALVVYKIAVTGEYRIVVNAYGPGGYGHYRLRLTSLSQVPPQ
jgi:hypothetical protein